MATGLKPEPIRRRGVLVQAWVPRALKERLDLEVTASQRSIRAVVIEALEKYLASRLGAAHGEGDRT